MKVLVTGGAGFIGANLVKRLLERREVEAINVIDDLSSGFLSNIEGLGVKFFQGSILNTDVLTAAAAAFSIRSFIWRLSRPCPGAFLTRCEAMKPSDRHPNGLGSRQTLGWGLRCTRIFVICVRSESSDSKD